jgi:uncharacterized protein
MAANSLSTALVDEIPVIWEEPARRRQPPNLALWLPPFSTNKEWAVPFLDELTGEGFVAVSIDPWAHGERGKESPEQLRARVFGDFRHHMWPILGLTTLDCLRVLDWARENLDISDEVVAGGVSMGGDIAVALAGIDPQVVRVATIGSTPDWTRPGMRDLGDPGRVLPQGTADTYAQWFYDRLDPFTHLERYESGSAISFECGADDTHISPDWALRFRGALAELDPHAHERVRVDVHPGLSHLESAQSPELRKRCVAWLGKR